MAIAATAIRPHSPPTNAPRPTARRVQIPRRNTPRSAPRKNEYIFDAAMNKVPKTGAIKAAIMPTIPQIAVTILDTYKPLDDVGAFLPRHKKSTTVTVHREFIVPLAVDIAAANTPAIRTPLKPAG